MNRIEFIGDRRVLRTKRRGLPLDQILVKLRRPGEEPSWERLYLDDFFKKRRFRGVASRGDRDQSNGA